MDEVWQTKFTMPEYIHCLDVVVRLMEPDGSFSLYSFFPGYTLEEDDSGPPAGGYAPQPPKPDLVPEPEPTEVACGGDDVVERVGVDVAAPAASSSADSPAASSPTPLTSQGKEKGRGKRKRLVVSDDEDEEDEEKENRAPKR